MYSVSERSLSARCSRWTVQAEHLLLLGQDHLLALALSLGQVLLLGVLAHVLLASLDRHQLLPLDLARLLDRLRHVTLASDSADFRHVRVSLDQGLVVLELGPLTSALYTAAVGCVCAPKSDVAIVGAGQDVLVIGGKLGGEDTVERSQHCNCLDKESESEIHTVAYAWCGRCRESGPWICSTSGSFDRKRQ